jgi:hypothetical protein
MKRTDRPTIVKRVETGSSDHLSNDDVRMLFDWLWEQARRQFRATIELDLGLVRSTDPRFSSEFQFLRRYLRQQGGDIWTTTQRASGRRGKTLNLCAV